MFHTPTQCRHSVQASPLTINGLPLATVRPVRLAAGVQATSSTPLPLLRGTRRALPTVPNPPRRSSCALRPPFGKTYDGAGADVARSIPGTYTGSLEPGGSAARATLLLREGKQLRAVVMTRAGSGRCVWSVDVARGLSARVLEAKTVPRGQQGRDWWFVGFGWDMVVVAYVGKTVHVRTPQLQAPTHRPQDLGQMS